MGEILTSATNAKVAVQTTTTAVLVANARRKYARITNTGSNVVFLGLGTAGVADIGVQLPANGTFEIGGDNLYVGAINGIAITGASNVAVLEL